MSEETGTAPEGAGQTVVPEAEPDVEKQAFLDRLNKEGAKRKEAEKKAAALEKRLHDLEAAAQEREQAGLPELERERKRAEALEKKIAEAEQRATDSEARVARTQREQWVSQAASAANFANPARAARLIDDLDSIEDQESAERAVASLARSDSYLLKPDQPKQPNIGRVLENGKAVTDPILTKEQVEAMSPAEIDERWDEVQAFLATQ